MVVVNLDLQNVRRRCFYHKLTMPKAYLKRHGGTYCNVQTAHEIPRRADVGAVSMYAR